MHKVMSAKQIAANRRNVRLSTGPKTRAGPDPGKTADFDVPPNTTSPSPCIKISNQTHLQPQLQLRLGGLDAVPTPML